MKAKRAKPTRSAKEILNRRFYEGHPQRIEQRAQIHRNMALGMKIRRLREDLGWTQRELAKRIGTQPSAISRIEDADYDGHSVALLAKVAEALDMMLIIDFEPRHSPGRSKAKTKV